jgi:hypothetical protein
VPPLISIAKVTAHAGLFGLLRSPRQVGSVTLEGLRIEVPPKVPGAPKPKPAESKDRKPDQSPLVIGRVTADGTVLRILPRDPGKQPLQFDIERFTGRSAGLDRPMTFEAVLRNAKPPGLIRSNGRFGPWQVDDPGQTAVEGDYTFQNADLSVFKGIAGMLSSTGNYRGMLERIEAQGTTDVPDFMLRAAGRPMRLKTEYHAIIDGTNGDTLLQPVVAHFLNSTVVARGGVTGTPGVKGKTVSLDATVSEGRVEDMLRLAVKSDSPVLTGAIAFRSKIVIPPGDRDIAEKLFLDGTFGIDAAKFSNSEMQKKVATLSQRGQGDTGDVTAPLAVASDFDGAFTLKEGSIRFSRLRFKVPGAAVALNGSYGLRSGELDFRGEARTDAKVSEMTTGVKSFFLKLVDPLFEKKKHGAVIPIRIGGTREKPDFGLDAGKVLGK